MNSIEIEFQRLTELSKSKEGWEEIENAWFTAINNEKIEGHWYSKGESKGSSVDGFAIDPITGHCIICSSNDHSRAYFDMIDWIVENESTIDMEDIYHRPIKGWIGKILDFEFPCILVEGSCVYWDKDLLIRVECLILKKEVGLPLNGLFLSKI